MNRSKSTAEMTDDELQRYVESADTRMLMTIIRNRDSLALVYERVSAAVKKGRECWDTTSLLRELLDAILASART